MKSEHLRTSFREKPHIPVVSNPGRSCCASHNDDWRLISFSSAFGCDQRELHEIAAHNVVGWHWLVGGRACEYSY